MCTNTANLNVLLWFGADLVAWGEVGTDIRLVAEGVLLHSVMAADRAREGVSYVVLCRLVPATSMSPLYSEDELEPEPEQLTEAPATSATQQCSNALQGSQNHLPPSYDARLMPSSTISGPSDRTEGARGHLEGAGRAGTSTQNRYQPPDTSAYLHDHPDAFTPKKGAEASPIFAGEPVAAAVGGTPLTGRFTQHSNSSFRTCASGMASPVPQALAGDNTYLPEEHNEPSGQGGTGRAQDWTGRAVHDVHVAEDEGFATAGAFHSMPDSEAGMFRSAASHATNEGGSLHSTLAGFYTEDSVVPCTPRGTLRGTEVKEFLTANDMASHDSDVAGCSSSQAAEGSLQAPNTPSRDASGDSNAHSQAPKKSGGVLEALGHSPSGAVVVGAANKAIPKLSRQLVRQLNRFKSEQQLFLQRFQMAGGDEHRRFGGIASRTLPPDCFDLS